MRCPNRQRHTLTGRSNAQHAEAHQGRRIDDPCKSLARGDPRGENMALQTPISDADQRQKRHGGSAVGLGANRLCSVEAVLLAKLRRLLSTTRAMVMRSHHSRRRLVARESERRCAGISCHGELQEKQHAQAHASNEFSPWPGHHFMVARGGAASSPPDGRKRPYASSGSAASPRACSRISQASCNT